MNDISTTHFTDTFTVNELDGNPKWPVIVVLGQDNAHTRVFLTYADALKLAAQLRVVCGAAEAVA